MPFIKFMKSRLLLLFVMFSLSISSLAYSQAVDSSVKIINSDAGGVTLEFGLSGLEIENKEFNNNYYNLISYKDCSFTSDTGKPKLPNSQVFLGVPPSVSVSVNIVDSAYTDAFGYTPNPVPNIISRKSTLVPPSNGRTDDGLESLVEEFVIDKEFYRQNTLYPAQNAKIVYEGNFRHQRVVILELCPIQYNPALKLLRKYTKLVVRVSFSGNKLAPLVPPSNGRTESVSAKNKVRDVEFENSYKSLLLNYESAKDWRGNSSLQKAPANQSSPKITEQALKIFVGQKGIYKLDYAMLKGAGIDPSVIDPRTFKVRFLDSEVPIYVHGEADGKFNTADYVEFFGAKPISIYTRWNTYWLTWGGDRGVRMVQKSGVPSSPTATEVTFFKSKVHFEEDHLHHKLQHSFSDPNDPDSWFESRDHWFWTGVENGSPKNEATINFPVYDLAQSLSKPDFKIELVGCTNYAHEAMISVNGFRAGEEANWNSQDVYSFDGQIPIDALKEGFDNVLRISRIGIDPSDGNDMDSYPYQLYLNWFELGYFRKLMAVNDSLEFSAPEEKASLVPPSNGRTEKPLFSISLDNKTSLDKGKIPPELNQKLRNTKVTLSEKAVLSVLESGTRWMVTDNQQTFLIKKEIDKLSVYSNEINDYTVSGFLDNNVEVFQISGDNAVSRFKDVVVKEYKLNQDDKNRIKIIMNGVSNNDKFSTLVPPSNGRTYPKIPDVAYSATFEDDGGQTYDYMAVTTSSILKPDRIELDVPSNLKETSLVPPSNGRTDLVPPSNGRTDNRADYIIISHPMFIDVAKKLADWRSSADGGSFVTRVIDVTDVYDEFGNGMVSPRAIKDFLTYAYNNWTQPAPSYVLLFGDATYDFLGNEKEIYKEAPELIGFIPSFYIKTTFGQTAVDHWYSAIDGNDGFPDIHLGRIPVEEVEEAENAVEKIIANESGRVNGQWRKQIVSIADDDSYAAGDEIFQEGLEDIYKYHTPVAYDTEKIYLKDIMQQVQQNPSEKRIPADVTQSMIMDSFANGSVISQYSGHGGRHVWAHEIILSITDIENLKETETYPFLTVFSCYNGYFDVPGELCMAEGMLRAKKKGVVAMFSATRLTYGPGNVALNNFIFDSIFKDKIRRIGQAVSIAKTRVVKEEGVMWLSQMYQYTLFGDPASKLCLPDYEVYPKTANASVSPGGKLDVSSGQVVKSVDGQSVSINGNMTATMIFPDGSKDVKNISIVNGVFPAVSYNIPKSVTAGQGVLKLYGQSGSESVVGGMEFSISQPYFANVSHEIADDKLQIYAKIDDDVDSSNLVPPSNGRTELKSVVLIWNMNSGENESQMIFDQEKKAYKIQEPIKLSFQSKDISYRIKATDVDGNFITSDLASIKLPYKPNLIISRNSDNSETSISYTYLVPPSNGRTDSNLFDKWGVGVDVINASNTAISLPVRVIIFDGNPDQNNDKIVDKDAKILAETTIKVSDWTPLSDQQIQTASVFMPCSLPMGRQMIFAWIDPVTDVTKSNFGVYDEENENDNIAFKIIDVTHALLAPGQGASTKSVDNVFQIAMQSDSVKQDSVISIENINDINIPSNQPSISFVTFSGGNKEGYILHDSLNNTGKTSPATNFDKPVSVKMRFDLLPLKEEIKKELGLNGIPDSQLEPEQLDVIEKTLEDRVSNVGIYLWYESAKRWARLPSTAVLDDKVQAFLIDDVKKTGNGIVSLIYTDENANTPVDDWNISFIDSDHFNVAGNKTGIIKKGGQVYSGTVGDEFYDNVTGIHIKLIFGLTPFSSNDRLSFKTIDTGIIEAESQWAGIFSLMLSNDSRPPNIKIDVADQNFADGDVVSSEPKIHALISDDNGIDLLYRNIDILMSLDAGEFKPAKQEDYIFNWEPSSNDVAVNFAPGKLEPGNYEAKFQAYDLNGNLGVRSIKFEVKSEFEIEEKSLMNYPNPFERETDIVFQLSSVADDAIVKIYTVSGRLIRTLEDQNVINFVTIHWDGRDEDGKEVANGVYYYKLRLKRQGRKDIVETGKMLKLK
jgi:hypothetical protein